MHCCCQDETLDFCPEKSDTQIIVHNVLTRLYRCLVSVGEFTCLQVRISSAVYDHDCSGTRSSKKCFCSVLIFRVLRALLTDFRTVHFR